MDNEKIRILEVIDTFLPTTDGVIMVVDNYLKGLNKMAECVLIAPKSNKKQKLSKELDYSVMRCKSVNAPKGYRCALPIFDYKFKRQLKKMDFDIIHVHTPFTMGRFALGLAKKKKIPLVATLHTQYHQDFNAVLKNNKMLTNIAIKYIVKVFNKASNVWTVSNASKRYLRDYGYKGDIDVMRNGTDYVLPDNQEELICKVNSINKLENQKNVFLFVGRMAWYKNLKLICDGLKILKDHGLDFKMIFVGGGFDYEEVVAYAKKIDIFDKCIFVGFLAERTLLQGYYLRSDLLLFPSTFDMASIALQEAAAHKLATLTVKGSCSAEQIIDGENGFLCEENAESFAERIEAACKDNKLKTVGENAYNSIYRSWDDVMKDVLEKYKHIIDDYKRNGNNKKSKK